MRRATTVVGLGFGDEGKGSVVDYLTRERDVKMIVRFNGGGQAAHNVVTPDGKHHTFSQFGSGLLAKRVPTYLSRFFLFDPFAFINEANHLETIGVDDPMRTVFVSPDALVVTPFHKAANRIREARFRHGTCGMGIGETEGDRNQGDAIRVADLRRPSVLLEKLRSIQSRKRGEMDLFGPGHEDIRDVLDDTDAPGMFADTMRMVGSKIDIAGIEVLRGASLDGEVIYEGAQGVLLDQWHGFHPHTTWSKTTFVNANDLIREVRASEEFERIGVTRAYMTRHGAGPMPSEYRFMPCVGEKHNSGYGIQGPFRYGWFDEVLMSYAIECCRLDGGLLTGLAVTHLDQFQDMQQPFLCEAYDADGGSVIRGLLATDGYDRVHQEWITDMLFCATPRYVKVPPFDVDIFLRRIESRLKVPVVLQSFGPTASQKHYTRDQA